MRLWAVRTNAYLQRSRYIRCNFVLHLDCIATWSVICLRPAMRAISCVDQLRCNAHPVLRPAHAPLYNVGRAKPRANGSQILIGALELERGSTPNDTHAWNRNQE